MHIKQSLPSILPLTDNFRQGCKKRTAKQTDKTSVSPFVTTTVGNTKVCVQLISKFWAHSFFFSEKCCLSPAPLKWPMCGCENGKGFIRGQNTNPPHIWDFGFVIEFACWHFFYLFPHWTSTCITWTTTLFSSQLLAILQGGICGTELHLFIASLPRQSVELFA